MALSLGVAVLASARWGMLLLFLSAALSCTLQVGYSASAVLMTAHAAGERGAWVGSVSDVARALTPHEVVNHVLLQPLGPTAAQLLEHDGRPGRGFFLLSNGTDENSDDSPIYVVAWFTFNAVAANLFGLLSIFFLCTVDAVRIWEGICKGLVCLDRCQASRTHPTFAKMKSVQLHATKVHCMYNVVSQGVSALVTLPHFCPVPCKPQVSFAYLGTLGLIISSLKFFELIIHQIAISVENIRCLGRSAWQLCDAEVPSDKKVGQDDRVVRLMQICLDVAQNAETAVDFSKEYIKEDVRQGVSLTVGLATFPVQPFGLGLSVLGVLIKDLLPELEKDLLADVPAQLKEAQDIEEEGDFCLWLGENKYGVGGWKLCVRELTDKLDTVTSRLYKLKAVIKAVVGQGFTISFSGKHKARLSVDDALRVVDPLVRLLQSEVDALGKKLRQLADALRLYEDKLNAPVDAEVRQLIKTIRQLLPVGIVSSFVKDTPYALLERLLSMMEASKKAGAEELMLEVSREFVSLADWTKEQQVIEEGVASEPGADEVVRQGHEADVGYAAGGFRRFALLTSGNRYSQVSTNPPSKVNRS